MAGLYISVLHLFTGTHNISYDLVMNLIKNIPETYFILAAGAGKQLSDVNDYKIYM